MGGVGNGSEQPEDRRARPRRPAGSPETPPPLRLPPRMMRKRHGTPLDRRINRFSHGHLDPLLRGYGFRYRKRRDWNRRSDACWHAIHVDAEKWPATDAVVLRVACGVFFPEAFRARTGQPPNPTLVAAPWDCTVRFPLGAVMAGGWLAAGTRRGDANDHVWYLRAATDPAQLAREVGEALEAAGLPFLDRFCSPAAVAALTDREDLRRALSVPYPDLAALKVALGDGDGAKRVLQTLVRQMAQQRTRRPNDVKWLRQLAARLGFELESLLAEVPGAG